MKSIDLLSYKKLFVDECGREFFYVFVPRPNTKKVIVHFSAFFGDWGDRKEYKDIYQGYFHRLKMLGPEEEYSSLFLCDQYGATKNGTYYLGEKGDLFVEKAISKIIESVFYINSFSFKNCVMLGSSMGATAALKFGLMYNVKGIIAISPHIDLDICAKMQGREVHVNFVCPDANAYNEENFYITRKIRNLVSKSNLKKELPILFLHSSVDDLGVYSEQVLPLYQAWKNEGGRVFLDTRKEGGHTSDYAHKQVILQVLDDIFYENNVNVKKLQSFSFLPPTQKTFKYQFLKRYNGLKSAIKHLTLYLKK